MFPAPRSLVIALLAIAQPALAEPTFTMLPEVPGAKKVEAVSADGSAIVGHFEADKVKEAFHFSTETEEVWMLGDLPGGAVKSEAKAVSADGFVVVGKSGSEQGDEAFHWDYCTDAMQGLGDLPGGDFKSEAKGISANGRLPTRPCCSPRGSTEGLRLVERFTRIDADTLEYEFTATDPGTWTSARTASAGGVSTPDRVSARVRKIRAVRYSASRTRGSSSQRARHYSTPGCSHSIPRRWRRP